METTTSQSITWRTADTRSCRDLSVSDVKSHHCVHNTHHCSLYSVFWDKDDSKIMAINASNVFISSIRDNVADVSQTQGKDAKMSINRSYHRPHFLYLHHTTTLSKMLHGIHMILNPSSQQQTPALQDGTWDPTSKHSLEKTPIKAPFALWIVMQTSHTMLLLVAMMLKYVFGMYVNWRNHCWLWMVTRIGKD